MLPQDEQQLSRRLSVFVGGFSIEAAQAVATYAENRSDTIVDGVSSLISKSFLRRHASKSGTRFSMLETIREYGLEILAESGEEPTIRRARADWCLAIAERVEPELNGPEQRIWVERLEFDLGNIRSAFSWLQDVEDAETALRLAVATSWFWTMPCRFHEALVLVENLIVMPGVTTIPYALAGAMATTADLKHWLGDCTRAAELYQQ